MNTNIDTNIKTVGVDELIPITPLLFNMFGKYIVKNDTNSLGEPDGLKINMTIEESLEYFKLMINNILDDKMDDINIVKFKSCLKQLLCTNAELVNETLIDIFDTETLVQAEKIGQYISSETFTLEQYIDIYEKMQQRTDYICKLLEDFEKLIEKDNKYSSFT